MRHFPGIRISIAGLLVMTAFAVAAVACGGQSTSDIVATESANARLMSGDDGKAEFDFGADGPAGAQGPAGMPGRLGASAATVTAGGSIATGSSVFADEERSAVSPPQPAAQPTITPPLTEPEDGGGAFDTGNESPPLSPLELQQPQIGIERVIVRNVELSIEVTDPAGAIEQISRLATDQGGWVVRTQAIEVHRGSIDIRVPSDQLDQVLNQLRGLADNVVSEVSTSQDFTEEFTDTSARIQTLQDTVDALRELFSRAEKIEDALTIQQEITRVQSDIEAMQARINFLSQSAAFSLVRVAVLALPQEMAIDAGGDRLAAVGRTVRLRAEFTPPEGIEDFRIEWDFGDGSSRQVVTAVAPVNTEGRVISAPVVHVYRDETDSPYIVKVTVSGTGESGAAEGEDVLVVTVNRVPPIEVFAGDNRIVEEGKKVTLSGSFTRPDGVDSLRYTWDFGDGSAPVTIDAEADATVAEVEHIYANSRPQSYNVVLTVQGETPAGSTEGMGHMQVFVEEPESLTTSGFTPGDSGRSAVRALSSIGAGLATAAIWIGVFSPLWLAAIVIAFLLYRNRKRGLAD